MKKCTRCGTEKPYTEFYRASRSSDGYQPGCKKCMDVLNIKSRAKHPDHYNVLRRERSKLYQKQIKDWKKQQKCLLCSETEWVTFDLHHLDPSQKDKDPSKITTYGGFMKEAKKCVVLCANCHRKVHAGLLTIPEGSAI